MSTILIDGVRTVEKASFDSVTMARFLELSDTFPVKVLEIMGINGDVIVEDVLELTAEQAETLIVGTDPIAQTLRTRFDSDLVVLRAAEQDAQYDEYLKTHIIFEDDDNPVAEYFLENGPAWVSVDSTTGDVTGTPLVGDLGDNVFVVKVVGLTDTFYNKVHIAVKV